VEPLTDKCASVCGFDMNALKTLCGNEIGIVKKCSNPCKNPEFLHYSTVTNLCYKSDIDKTMGDNGAVVTCIDYCGYDKTLLASCTDGSEKLCDNPCLVDQQNQEYLHYSTKTKLCYKTKN
jgi:hypothetical protein